MEGKVGEVYERKSERYFIAVIPPTPAYEAVQQIKTYFLGRYNTKAALNSPPHITLHMPFEWKREKETMLCDALASFFEKQNDFAVELLNFSCFAPKTIFINVVKNQDLERLETELYRFCKKELNLFNARYRDLPFHPHVTVAFRDLNKSTFANAWAEFAEKKFAGKFNVGKVSLLKHNGTLWEPCCYFSLT